MIVIGMILLMYPVLTMLYGSYRQRVLLQARERLVKEHAQDFSLNPELKTKTPIGKKGKWPLTKIEIPSIGVSQIVQESITNAVLREGPGHYPDTANPGEVGWCAIAGHRITFSSPFDRLDELKKGDLIILETIEARFVYRVYSSELKPEKTPFEMPKTDEPRVALTTCHPKTGSTHRLAVRGVLLPYPQSRYLNYDE